MGNPRYFLANMLFITIVFPVAAQAGEAQYDWSGFYLGASLGHHEVQTSGEFGDPETRLAVTPDLEGIGDEGGQLGIQGGYSHQIERVILGVEGDFSFGNFQKSLNTIQDGSRTEAGLFSYPIEGNLEYLATIRGRVGYDMEALIHHPVLLFVTGGVAFTHFEMDIANGRSEIGFGSTGPTWGVGFQLPVSPRVLLRAEYQHIEFDKRLNISGLATSGIFDAQDGNYVKLENVDLFRVGFDFLLGGR